MSRRFEVAGVICEETGNPDAETTLLFVHGVGASSEVWRLQLSLLKEYSLVAIELPGHGESGAHQGVGGFDAHARALGDVVSSLNRARVVAVGHHLGAALAATTSTQGTPFIGICALSLGIRLAASRIFDVALDLSSKHFLDLVSATALSARAHPDTLKKLRVQGLSAPTEVLHADLEACRSWRGRARLPKISIPTLFLCGEEDALLPPMAVEAAAELVPDHRFAMIEDAGHFAMLEQPFQFNELVASFVESLDKSSRTNGGN